MPDWVRTALGSRLRTTLRGILGSAWVADCSVLNVTAAAFFCKSPLFQPNAVWTSPLPTKPLPETGSKVTDASATDVMARVPG